MSQSRQLAAIMFTDIVGYTSLMGKDSAKALELIRINKKIQKPLVEKHHGQWLKEMGDGALAKFGTALDAVLCAVDIQKTARVELDGKLRIGIHSGDITIENDDVYGDGVNVASRLESIADPGGIYISDAIEKAIRGQSDVQAKYLGESKLKNVDYGVRTYAVQGVGLPVPEVKDVKELSGHFWAEVQRRGVIRATVSYMAISLLLVILWNQIKDWGVILPQWWFDLLLTVLGIGFPLAIYFAWKYERGPDGFIKTTSRQSWQNPLTASQRKPLTGSFVIAGLVLIIVIMYLYPQQNTTDHSLKPLEPKLESPVTDKSIAVIPFVDMSPKGDHEWFSDGISEELLNALVRIPGLKVVGRTSSWTYKGVTNKDLKEIGKELGVGSVLEGSVRKSGTNIRITAQLVNTEDGFHLWSHTYDRELTDIFAVQDEITAAIVDAMKVYVSNESFSLRQTTTADIDAYTIYLQARQKLALRGIENLIEARRLFEEAIRLDPDYDPAYSGLARALSLFHHFSTAFSTLELVEPAKNAANKALELNPKNSEAFSVLGYIAAVLEWDWTAAEQAFNKSLELTHDDAEIYNFIGDYYRLVVQHPTLAIEMELRALKLDPLHPVNHDDLGWAYALAKDWENALQYAQSARNLGINYWANHKLLLNSYINLGRMEEAENVVARLDDSSDNYYANLYLRTILAIAKDESDVALSNIKLMVNYKEEKRYSWIGLLYLELGMLKEAAYWLKKGFENRESHLFTLTLPENLPDHPALQAALDQPELNELFEIRRKSLGLNDTSPL